MLRPIMMAWIGLSSVRLAVYGLALAAIAVLAWLVHRWHSEAQRVPALEAALEQARADFEAYRAESQRQYRIAQEVSNGYHQELARLRAERRPAPVVRVCRESDVPRAAVSGAAAGADAARPEGLPQAPGRNPHISRDIGGDLYGIADDGDQCAAQRDALIAWIRSSRKR
jgi:hypothetical protein